MLPYLAVELLAEALDVAVNTHVIRQLFDHLLNGVAFSREGAILPPHFSAIDVVLAHLTFFIFLEYSQVAQGRAGN
jgi:hypothetical protein